MNAEKNLKVQNAPFLWGFFLINAAIFVSAFYLEHINSFLNNELTMGRGRIAWLIFAPVIIFILNGLISSDQKATMVFWRLKYPLPGCRSFTRHALRDLRIDVDKLRALYGSLPANPKDQNLLWYRIYREKRDDVAIQKSHRDYLLARDMVSMTVLFILIVGIPSFFVGVSPLNYFYLSILMTEYFILVLVARNHGKRFVVNVLAAAST